MASPFSIFRKHQKSLMVVLVIGSMIAFTGESLFTADGPSWVLLGILLGTAISLIAGFQFGRPAEYAIGGALIGGLVGFAGPSIVGKQGMQSNLGTFDEQRVGELVARRSTANSFIAELQRRALGFGGGGPFGHVSQNLNEDVIFGEMLRAEARDIGIYIDDDAVTDFINEQTSQKLKPEDFAAVRKMVSMNNKILSEKELYNLLRDEIQATVAFRVLAPSGVGRKPRAATPDEYWDMFQRMNTRQQLAFAAVPVDSFLDSVGVPSESDIEAFFEEYKDKAPNQLEPGSPGLFQAQRMKLGYVEADYATIAASIEDPTEEEIKKYYEDNKDEMFVEDQLPEDPVSSEELPSLNEIEKQNAAEEKPEADDSGDTDKAPEDGASEEKPAEEKAEEGSEDEGNGCDIFQEDEEPATTEKASDEQEKPASESLPVPPAPLSVPQADPVDDKDPFELPKKYKPLDAEISKEISNALKREKVTAEMTRRINDALSEMKRLSETRDDFERENLGKKVDMTDFDTDLCKALKKYADANGLSYAETPLATGLELLNRDEYPIGSATPPGTQFQRVPNVVQTLFGAGGTPLFNAAPAEIVTRDGTVNQFVYWVLADIPSHEPKDLEEVGVRDQVIKAWKQQKARPLAEERAKTLAEAANDKLSEDNTLSDVIESETITGKDDSAKLKVTESLPFSWLRSSSAPNPMSFQPPSASVTQIDGVDGGVTDEFMKVLFEDLEPQEVGVAPNVDRSVFYIVQPLNRFPSDESDKDAARERFIKGRHFEQFSSPMPDLVRQSNARVNREWVRQLWTKYGFDLGT